MGAESCGSSEKAMRVYRRPGAIRQQELAFPVKRAFLERVNVSDNEDAHEREHAEENGIGGRRIREHGFVDDSPREHEYDLDVEQDEQHCDQIKFNRQTGVSLSNREHPALVCGIFRLANTAGFSKQNRQYKVASGKSQRDQAQDQNRNILL